MTPADSLVQSIRRHCADLTIESAELNDRGQNSRVLVVNGGLIFRFPRYAAGLQWLVETECPVLDGLQGQLPLAIPHFVYRHLDAPPGEAFVGYRMIPGEPLWRETLTIQDTGAAVEAILGQVAGFLRALHATPPDRFGVALPVRETRGSFVEMYARVREALFPHMRPDARDSVAQHFERCLGDPRAFDFTPTLRHGDFGAGNILFDAAAGRVTGVIDFGGACLGDPAADLAGLLACYGEDALGRIYAAYPAARAWDSRVRFYRGLFALEEALFGLDSGDAQAFEAGMRPYR